MADERTPSLPSLRSANAKTGPTIGDMLELPATRKKMAQIVPSHFSADRMLRIVSHAVYKTPDLAKASPVSLMGAIMTCASLGLEPNTILGHAYLIPFLVNHKDSEGKWHKVMDVQLIVGYKGYIDLAGRSGRLTSIHADVAYAGDKFSFEYGSNMHLRHQPIGAREGRRAEHAYSFAKFNTGEAFEVLPYENVLRIRDKSQAFRYALEGKEKGYRNWQETPWIANEHDMASKTMIRRLSKYLPLSPEMARAVHVDESSRIDYAKITADPEGTLLDMGAVTKPADVDEGNDGQDDQSSREKQEQHEEEGKEAKGEPSGKAKARKESTQAQDDGLGDLDQRTSSGKRRSLFSKDEE